MEGDRLLQALEWLVHTDYCQYTSQPTFLKERDLVYFLHLQGGNMDRTGLVLVAYPLTMPIGQG